jgi:hypothetical protein
MARMPGTQWVGPYGERAMTRYDVVCLHTIVGDPPAPAAHFSVRADGLIYQSRDTALRSAANYQGNHRVIAIENDDRGPEYGAWDRNDGHAVPGFTDAQVEANARICVWAHRVHKIPLVPCPDSRPASRGIAYHRQGIDGNWAGYRYGGRVVDGEVWTESRGKVCPGDRRIEQIITRVIPRARQLAGLDPGGEDMDPAQNDTLNALAWRVHALINGLDAVPDRQDVTPAAVRGEQMWFVQLVKRLEAKVGQLSNDEANIIAAIRSLPAPGDLDEAALAAMLAPVLAPLIQVGTTPEQIEAAVQQAIQQAFARAGQS